MTKPFISCFLSGAALSLLAAIPSLAQDTATVSEQTPVPAREGSGARSVPIPLVPPTATWDSFHGQLNAQKYSALEQITAANVGDLEKVWEVHTGDMSDGSGDKPATVWSATPIFANDTLINSAPTLMDITVDGREIPALIQATKQGFLFVVNRKTGEDVWPIEERPVPAGDGTVKGEVYAKTQPFPTKPAPLLDQSEKPKVWGLADVASFGACSRLWDKLSYEGMYTPPATAGEGALAYPDSAGGVQWGGVAFEPESQTAVVNVSHVTQSIQLYDREDYERAQKAGGNESGGFSPQKGAPYGLQLKTLLNWLGMPCWEPPFGELVALDMHTGDVKWRRPIGASQKYGFFMPESWGSPTIGGPAVTAGGVIFIGASMDAKLRAYSLETGEELWEDQAMAPAVANPAVYEYKGREYVAFVAGGNTILKDQVGDQVVAYALPE